jgi:hypothetical protein
MTKQPVSTTSMVEQIARTIATADGAKFEHDPGRFRTMALAALKPLTRPTEEMVDAAYEAVRFDEHWAVNSRRDFRKGVRAMILAAMDG